MAGLELSRAAVRGSRGAVLGRRAALILSCFFLFWLLVGGGASRADVQSLVFVRVSAVATLGVLLFSPALLAERPIRPVLAFLALCMASVALQLVPLPPDMWTALPGRQMAQAAAAVAGLEPGWRPLSLTPDRTLNTLVSLFPPTAALVVVALVGKEGQPNVLQFVLMVIGASAALGAMQIAAGPNSMMRFYEITNQDSAVGLFSNRNHQALFLACGFPIAAWWIGRTPGLAQRAMLRWAALGAAFLFLMVMILTTGSRGGLVVGLVGLILAVALLVPLRPAPPWPVFAAVGAVVAGAVGWLGWQRFEAIDRFFGPGNPNEIRIELLPEYERLFWTYFPAGSGYGSFPDVYRAVERIEHLSPTYLNNAHNDLAQLGIEGGLPGLLLLAVALLWLTPKVVRIAFSRPLADGAGGRSGRAAAIVIVLLLIGSLIDYPLRTPLLASLFVACCAILSYSLASRARPRSKDRVLAAT